MATNKTSDKNKKAGGKAAKKKSTKRSSEKKSAKETPTKAKKLSKKELKKYEDLLWELRDRITDEISFLSGDNVNRSNNHGGGEIARNGGDAGDQGSANFDREFALSLMSSEQDVVYDIDQALQRIKDGTYGICEMTGNRIEKERLKAIPYARYSVAAKTEMEKQQGSRRRMT